MIIGSRNREVVAALEGLAIHGGVIFIPTVWAEPQRYRHGTELCQLAHLNVCNDSSMSKLSVVSSTTPCHLCMPRLSTNDCSKCTSRLSSTWHNQNIWKINNMDVEVVVPSGIAH